MAEILIEILSEEIPARMQKNAAEYLYNSLCDGLSKQGITDIKGEYFYGARRLVALFPNIETSSKDTVTERKGPKVGANEQALEGFLRGAGLTKDQLEIRNTDKGDFYFANIHQKGKATKDIIAELMPAVCESFPWQKSMRWGNGSKRWVRPIQEILAIVSDAGKSDVINFSFAEVSSGNQTRGHHFIANELFEVKNFADYKEKLKEKFVILSQDERKELIEKQLNEYAQKHDLTLLEDKGLLEEVNGLCEYPLIVVGDIAEKFLHLPVEVLKTSMRTHQKFFSLVDKKTGKIAKFVTLTNQPILEAHETILIGNRKVLSARLSDACYFYDTDLKSPLESYNQKLKNVTYHAKLGSQEKRVERLGDLAKFISTKLNVDGQKVALASKLSKADLMTQMVGEFPELQGLMGRYYALAQNVDSDVADSLAEHYKPQGASDSAVMNKVSVCVALADKLSQLAGFWVIDEKPTGSKDPYALRRAALGVIRILIDNEISLDLNPIFDHAVMGYDAKDRAGIVTSLQEFILERLRVYARDKNIRHDVVSSLLDHETDKNFDVLNLLKNMEVLNEFIISEQGVDILASYKRAVNILTAEEKKQKTEFSPVVEKSLFENEYEESLFEIVAKIENLVNNKLTKNDLSGALGDLSLVKQDVYAFLENVMINVEQESIRKNRLSLLAYIREIMHKIADFSKIE